MDQVAHYLPGIALAYAAFLISIMSPGPNVLAILGTSMSAGRARGIGLALGVSTGSFLWAFITVLGLSAVIAAYAIALTAIKILGGAYLLWLAYNAFRSAASDHDIEAKKVTGAPHSVRRYFVRGITVQMTNPKAALAWIAIISLGLQEGAPLWVGFTIVAGTTLLSVVLHCLYAVAFSTETMLRIYGRARRWIQGAIGTMFCVAGLKLLTDRS